MLIEIITISAPIKQSNNENRGFIRSIVYQYETNIKVLRVAIYIYIVHRTVTLDMMMTGGVSDESSNRLQQGREENMTLKSSKINQINVVSFKHTIGYNLSSHPKSKLM